MIWNSSSGIIEAASFNKPVINIGSRQSGRLKGDNILDCSYDNIEKTIKTALSKKFLKRCIQQKNIYGDGKAAERIVKTSSRFQLSTTKKFSEIEFNLNRMKS